MNTARIPTQPDLSSVEEQICPECPNRDRLVVNVVNDQTYRGNVRRPMVSCPMDCARIQAASLAIMDAALFTN